jgi:CheY-like chemotaxis protein
VQPDWQIIEAVDGEDALKKVEDAEIDWMTIDFNMPGMDGMELAEKLKSKFPDAHISLLTAHVQDATRKKAEALGIEFIGKPITEYKIISYVA